MRQWIIKHLRNLLGIKSPSVMMEMYYRPQPRADGEFSKTHPPLLAELFGIISDPLAWQDAMDNASAGINMSESMRFWTTVNTLGLEMVWRNGAPEFSEIIFRLQGNIGLRLWVEAGSDDPNAAPFIHFAFCEIDE